VFPEMPDDVLHIDVWPGEIKRIRRARVPLEGLDDPRPPRARAKRQGGVRKVSPLETSLLARVQPLDPEPHVAPPHPPPPPVHVEEAEVEIEIDSESDDSDEVP
jgi:hypothetical protein